MDDGRYLMFYAQSTAKGQIRAKQNVFLPQVKIPIHNLKHIPPLKIWGSLQKMKLNEPGRQKLGRYKGPCKQAQHTLDIHRKKAGLALRDPSLSLNG